MRKLQLLLVLLIATMGVSSAQTGQGGQRMSPEEREKRLVEQLGLDEAQQTKLSEINKRFSELFSEIRKQMQDADDDARKELFPKMRELMEKRNTEIRAILTKEQAEKFDEMQKQREERMKNRRPPSDRGGDTRPGK